MVNDRSTSSSTQGIAEGLSRGANPPGARTIRSVPIRAPAVEPDLQSADSPQDVHARSLSCSGEVMLNAEDELPPGR